MPQPRWVGRVESAIATDAGQSAQLMANTIVLRTWRFFARKTSRIIERDPFAIEKNATATLAKGNEVSAT